MKKCPVLLVVSGFLTENDISWFNRIKAGGGLDVRYYKWESANLLSILSSDIANEWGLYTLFPLRTSPLLSSISIPFKARQAWYNATKAAVNNREKLARVINGKRAARTVLTGMCYSVGSATRQGSSSLTRFIGQSAMTLRT